MFKVEKQNKMLYNFHQERATRRENLRGFEGEKETIKLLQQILKYFLTYNIGYQYREDTDRLCLINTDTFFPSTMHLTLKPNWAQVDP